MAKKTGFHLASCALSSVYRASADTHVEFYAPGTGCYS